MKKRVIGVAKELVTTYLNRHVSRSAAELSYFLVLSMFPFLIFVNVVLGSLNINEANVVSMLYNIVPDAALSVITGYLDYVNGNDSTMLLILGIVTAVMSSASAFRSIINIMTEIQGKPRYKGIFSLLFSFVLSLVLMAVIFVSIIIMMTGEWFVQLLLNNFEVLTEILWIWRWVRFILLFCLLFFIIWGIYFITAPREKPHVHRSVGAMIASVLLVGVSMFFSYLISTSIKYTLVYGSLASIIILMVWLYMCGNILIMGNVFNIVCHNNRRKQLDIEK